MTQPTSSPEAAQQPEPVAEDTKKKSGSYGSGARILSIGIGLTGIVTFGYFALASNVLDPDSYGRISLLWIVLFIVVTVLYRPIEQLLSRTIASRTAAGANANHPLRIPALIQLGFAATFAVVALVLRDPIQNDLLGGYASLYWIFFVGAIAYAASYFARGWLAGHKRFELYGGLVLFESLSRILFPLAVLVGITSGQTAVALGMAAAPFVSLIVVPFAFSRRSRAAESAPGAAEAIELEMEAAAPGPGAEGAERREAHREADLGDAQVAPPQQRHRVIAAAGAQQVEIAAHAFGTSHRIVAANFVHERGRRRHARGVLVDVVRRLEEVRDARPLDLDRLDRVEDRRRVEGGGGGDRAVRPHESQPVPD